jgi:hypothetical protein
MAYGVVFRVGTSNRSRAGRLSVWCDDAGAAPMPGDVAAILAANLPGGRVVPLATAARMVRKRDRRRMGWPLRMILAGLPRPIRESGRNSA